MDTVSKAISGHGEAANITVDSRIVTNKSAGKAEQKAISASAHNLGRALEDRWARCVMPMVLKELMRHESVTTTEKFYVGINAQETARFLREVTPTKKGSQRKAETL
jgi:hypothetical protein